MKTTFFLITMFFMISCGQNTPSISYISQSVLNKEIMTNEDGSMLIGVCNRNGLLKSPYKTWFESQYSNYKVDSEILSKIGAVPKELHLLIFMGTWCGDSQTQVPRFYKILDTLNFDESNLTLINLNRQKTSPGNEEQEMNINEIPTFIFFKNNKEIGRIVESPVQSLEGDLYAILSGKSINK
ncbi:thioredoxin family protein [bacterium AH-315-M05]|nr:thioredoxin family protein [bacterium AH-315-M05]